MSLLQIKNIYTKTCQCCCVTCSNLGYLEECPKDQKKVPTTYDSSGGKGVQSNDVTSSVNSDESVNIPDTGPQTNNPYAGWYDYVKEVGDNYGNDADARGGGVGGRNGGKNKPSTLICQTIPVACPSNPSFQLKCCQCVPSS